MLARAGKATTRNMAKGRRLTCQSKTPIMKNRGARQTADGPAQLVAGWGGMNREIPEEREMLMTAA